MKRKVIFYLAASVIENILFPELFTGSSLIENIGTGVLATVIVCVIVKAAFKILHIQIRSTFGTNTRGRTRKSSPLYRMMHPAANFDPDAAARKWTEYFTQDGYGSGTASNYRGKTPDQKAYERYQARNEEIFHQNQARKNAGTYAGYQASNRARDAHERANRY